MPRGRLAHPLPCLDAAPSPRFHPADFNDFGRVTSSFIAVAPELAPNCEGLVGIKGNVARQK
jgi:hypothetical protein